MSDLIEKIAIQIVAYRCDLTPQQAATFFVGHQVASEHECTEDCVPCLCDDAIQQAQIIGEAIKEAGYAIVPQEPSSKMCVVVYQETSRAVSQNQAVAIYKAMLKAAEE